MLTAARDANVKRFIYAASSSTYGDSQSLPKVEDVIGKPLTPMCLPKPMEWNVSAYDISMFSVVVKIHSGHMLR